MNCTRARHLLDAWLDDELDAGTRDQVEIHFAECPACTSLRFERERQRGEVRQALRGPSAPAELSAKIRQALGQELARRGARPWGPSWVQALGLCAASAAGAVALTLAWVGMPDPAGTPDMVAERYAAALAQERVQAGAQVHVATSSRHVVKPWFQGRVDFAPPVPDLSAQGFELLGARMDRVGQNEAAVVVYRIRNHPIELFVWREIPSSEQALTTMTRRGYGIALWRTNGMRYAAISDVDPLDLRRFALALQAPLPNPVTLP